MTLLGDTYCFYVNLEDATDGISAVYGNNQATLAVDAPDGVFNSAANASWNASGINPAFLPVFPELAADTYATIGLEGPASQSGIASAADPSIVEDGGQTITQCPERWGDFDVEQHPNRGILVCVEHSGQCISSKWRFEHSYHVRLHWTSDWADSYQVFPLGNGALNEKYVTAFDGPGTFGELFVEVQGCMDSTVRNYDPDANLEPIGSCNLPDSADSVTAKRLVQALLTELAIATVMFSTPAVFAGWEFLHWMFERRRLQL